MPEDKYECFRPENTTSPIDITGTILSFRVVRFWIRTCLERVRPFWYCRPVAQFNRIILTKRLISLISVKLESVTLEKFEIDEILINHTLDACTRQ